MLDRSSLLLTGLLALCFASPAAGQSTEFFCSTSAGLTVQGFLDNLGTANPAYDLDQNGVVAFADLAIFIDECNAYIQIVGVGTNTTSAIVTIDDTTLPASLGAPCGIESKTLTSSVGKTPNQYRTDLITLFGPTCFSIVALTAPGSFKVAGIPKAYVSFDIDGCEVMGNISGGCPFNPTFFDLDEEIPVVPALLAPGLIAVCLFLAAAAAFAIRRDRRRSPAIGRGLG